MNNPVLLGQAEPFIDDPEISVQPRAGDICRLRGWSGLWIPYGGIGNTEEAGSFRFARFPHCDRVQVLDVSLVHEIILPAEFEEAQRAWAKVARLFPDGGTFQRKVFVYRQHGEPHDCAAIVFSDDGTELGAHVSMTLGFAQIDVDLYLPPDVEVVWCIGRAALDARIAAGELGVVSLRHAGG